MWIPFFRCVCRSFRAVMLVLVTARFLCACSIEAPPVVQDYHFRGSGITVVAANGAVQVVQDVPVCLVESGRVEQMMSVYRDPRLDDQIKTKAFVGLGAAILGLISTVVF